MNLLEGADHTPDIREELLNKWKDKPADELLKAKVEADLHIKNLERENAEKYQMFLQEHEKNKSLAAELLAKAKFEELVDQMKGSNNTQVAATQAKEADSQRFDPKDIETLFDKKLQDYERSKTETDNFRRVQNKLQDKFGTNYANVLKDQQSTLGLSDDDINSLAKRSPEAFFRMLGLNDQTKDTFQSPPRSGQRNDSFAPKGAPKRDYQYYQELKKTNPKLYLDPKISSQMERDAQEMGPSFFPD